MLWLIGYVVSERFKESGRSKKKRDYIIDFPGIEDRETSSLLIGRKIEYRDDTVRVKGVILRTHGVRGKVRARFSKPLPGKFWNGKVYVPLDSTLEKLVKRLETSSQTA